MNEIDIFNLDGKIAIVTGGYGKVGRYIVKALSELGCRVVIASRNKHYVDFGVYDNLIEFCKCDVTIKKDILKLKEKVLSKYKKIDILVNGVTGNDSASFEEMSLKSWEEAIKNGLNSIFLCTQIIGKTMKKRKSGNIINISSIYGLVAADQRIYGDSGLNSSIVYATIKSAILNFTRYVAVYWAKDGIRCNTLTLGGLEDRSNNFKYFRENYNYRVPLSRMMYGNDIKGAIYFLASDESSYYTGQNLILDGGWTAW